MIGDRLQPNMPGVIGVTLPERSQSDCCGHLDHPPALADGGDGSSRH